MKKKIQAFCTVLYFGLLCAATVALTVLFTLEKPATMVQAAGEEVYQEREPGGYDDETTQTQGQARVDVFSAPKYDFTVAIVPVGEQNEIPGEIEKKFRSQLADLTTEYIRVLLMNPLKPDELWKASEFMQTTQVDACILLTQGESDDAKTYGVRGRYNGSFYWEKLPVPMLCDIVVRNVAIAEKNRAVGLEETPAGDGLNAFTVPAVELTVGFTTNEKENALMQDAGYQEKIAGGLLEAIKELYGTYHED